MSSSELIGKKYPVLDYGYVILRDVMGTDQTISENARLSYGDGTRKVSDDEALIDYLMRHRHTSPFEMPVVRFQVKLPIFVERQWVRHRTCSMNEMSARYSVLPQEFYVPEVDTIRAQSTTNKQGRAETILTEYAGEFIDDVNVVGGEAFNRYSRALDGGVARELARISLPLGTYTEKAWQMNLHNLLHFLKLRTDSHAQWEIRQYANVIEEITAELFPVTIASWRNHVKEAVTFSKDEWEIIARALATVDAQFGIDNDRTLSKSRKAELFKKLGFKSV